MGHSFAERPCPMAGETQSTVGNPNRPILFIEWVPQSFPTTIIKSTSTLPMPLGANSEAG